jgi:UDP-glucose 4-epimerase
MEQVEISQALLEKDIEDRNRQLKAVLREHEILNEAHLLRDNESDFSSLQEPMRLFQNNL